MAAKTNFRGSFTALVTPFKNGSVDEQMFRDLVEWQIAEGTNGLVPVGTTGESPNVLRAARSPGVCADASSGPNRPAFAAVRRHSQRATGGLAIRQQDSADNSDRGWFGG